MNNKYNVTTQCTIFMREKQENNRNAAWYPITIFLNIILLIDSRRDKFYYKCYYKCPVCQYFIFFYSIIAYIFYYNVFRHNINII